MSFSLSLGAFAGPMLGGLGIQYLPQTREFGCPVTHTHTQIEEEEGGCVSGYRWTTLVLCGVSLCVWGLLVGQRWWEGRQERRKVVELVSVAVHKMVEEKEKSVEVLDKDTQAHTYTHTHTHAQCHESVNSLPSVSSGGGFFIEEGDEEEEEEEEEETGQERKEEGEGVYRFQAIEF
jgi:hypothetical protein